MFQVALMYKIAYSFLSALNTLLLMCHSHILHEARRTFCHIYSTVKFFSSHVPEFKSQPCQAAAEPLSKTLNAQLHYINLDNCKSLWIRASMLGTGSGSLVMLGLEPLCLHKLYNYNLPTCFTLLINR